MKEYPGSAFLTPFSFRQTNKLLKVPVNGFVSKKFPHHPVHTLDLYARANMRRRSSHCRYFLAGITVTPRSLPVLPLVF